MLKSRVLIKGLGHVGSDGEHKLVAPGESSEKFQWGGWEVKAQHKGSGKNMTWPPVWAFGQGPK